ncbi:hypothetical protein ACFSVM_09665 [Paenibacillus shunpengii]|uniref:Uncharacterized protein n=1 Tax=Paenibacillus shunpengii TaxID=2054424 RepID=A0ABW5SNF4_9BACL|nr:hypothetical protein [Paenibacillus sp. FSL H7-0326]
MIPQEDIHIPLHSNNTSIRSDSSVIDTAEKYDSTFVVSSSSITPDGDLIRIIQADATAEKDVVIERLKKSYSLEKLE